MVGKLEAGTDAGVTSDVADAGIPLQVDATVGDQPSNGNLEGGEAGQEAGQAATHHKHRHQRHYRGHGLGSEEERDKERRDEMGQLPSAARVADSHQGEEAKAGSTPRCVRCLSQGKAVLSLCIQCAAL